MVGLLPAAYVIAGVLAIPLWVRISRRFGARETWMAAMLLAAAAFAGIWFVGPGDLVLLLALLVVAGAAMGCGGVLVNALLADVIDLDARAPASARRASTRRRCCSRSRSAPRWRSPRAAR